MINDSEQHLFRNIIFTSMTVDNVYQYNWIVDLRTLYPNKKNEGPSKLRLEPLILSGFMYHVIKYVKFITLM